MGGGGLVRITVSVLLCDSALSPPDRLQLISDCFVYLNTTTVNSTGLRAALTAECVEDSSLCPLLGMEQDVKDIQDCGRKLAAGHTCTPCCVLASGVGN